MASSQTPRIIDASLNRIGEGLRLLEDISRLILNDVDLTQRLKNLRHELVRGSLPLHRQLLQARDSTGDIGMDLEVSGEEKERELPALVIANSRRVQESLRTLEELTKVPGIAPELDSEKFKQARFNIYTLEQKLLSRLLRQDKKQYISGLYVILDTQALRGRRHSEVARQVISGGARIIQLRDKITMKKKLLPLAQELKEICAEFDVLFIINDYLDIALATGADGLHIGQEDLPVAVARKLLPVDKILGCSVTTVAQAIKAQAEGADYIGVGAMFPTPSKEKIKVVGLKRLREVKKAVSIPVVAIGGITLDNAAEVMSADADSIAVISAVLGANDPEKATRKIIEQLEAKK